MATVVAIAADLFAPPPLPAGLEYREDFVTRDEEARLLAVFADLPFREATFQQYTARRRVVRFGRDYAAGAGQWIDGDPLPRWLAALRTRVARAHTHCLRSRAATSTRGNTLAADRSETCCTCEGHVEQREEGEQHVIAHPCGEQEAVAVGEVAPHADRERREGFLGTYGQVR